MQDTILQRYLNDVKPLKRLERNEEIELIKTYKKCRDKKILKQIVESNLRFVVSVALEFNNYRVDIKDLINEGNLGLIKAVSRYNPSKGVKFYSYAVWWIRQAMTTFLYDHGRLVRYPANKLVLINKITKLLAETNDMAYVAKKLNIPEKELNYVLNYEAISMDKNVNDEDNTTLHNILCSEEDNTSENEADNMKTIRELAAPLSAREKLILEKYYLFKQPLHVIGSNIGITRERVRQIKAKALMKMHNYSLVLMKKKKAADI